MKFDVPTTKEINITHIHLDLPVRYDEDDIPNDFPLRKGERWECDVEMDTGKISRWPQGRAEDFYMKVTDGGIYQLLDENAKLVAEIAQNYVPHGVVPGEYGDYIHFKINEHGIITNWPKKPNVSAFFESE